MPEFSVPIEHLRVGVFIRLDLKWYEHPFLLNHFKIKSDGQIQALKDLGLSQVTYDPLKSGQARTGAGSNPCPAFIQRPALGNEKAEDQTASGKEPEDPEV
jgi:hypothetical protein